MDSDDYNLWRQNMRDIERRPVLERLGWDKPGVIAYSMNRHGFRTGEFNQEPGIITLGCSFTAGIGLPNDQIWPTIVAQLTGCQVWNLGIGGAAMDTCFRLLHNYVDNLNVTAVLVLRPSSLRFETHYNDKVEVFMPNGYSNPCLDEVIKYWYSDTQNEIINTEKNTLAMQAFCNARGIKFVFKDTDIFNCPHVAKYPGARDLMHVGYAEQQQCAEIFSDSLS